MTDTETLRTIHRTAACRPLRTTVLIAALAVVLTACDRGVSAATPGEKLDSALATGERKLDNLKAESRTAGERLSETASEIGGAVTSLAGDAGLTARVKVKLADDAALNALKIDVDSANGRVTLTGEAPNATARERATTLALSVEGVLAVDNRLRVATAAVPR